jgi:hypothetical protein
MIHIFFVPGMFGSTVEYVLRDYTVEMTPTNATLKHDGSMHTFKKQNHPRASSMLDRMTMSEINTPIYPFNDMYLVEILRKYPIHHDDHGILLYAKSFEDAEQNILFQYHKVSTLPEFGIKIFHGSPANAHQDVKPWNQQYTDYSDLAPWEFREWFSIFYPTWISAWQTSVNQVPNNWLKIPSADVLERPERTFESIIKFCNLTKKEKLGEFTNQWRRAQQYILDEYHLINKIVESTVSNQPLEWHPINIIAEAIVQQRLRTKGYEIRCDGLDIFPTSAIILNTLLEKVHQ